MKCRTSPKYFRSYTYKYINMSPTNEVAATETKSCIKLFRENIVFWHRTRGYFRPDAKLVNRVLSHCHHAFKTAHLWHIFHPYYGSMSHIPRSCCCLPSHTSHSWLHSPGKYGLQYRERQNQLHFRVVSRNTRVKLMRNADWFVDTTWYQRTNQLCILTSPWWHGGTYPHQPLWLGPVGTEIISTLFKGDRASITVRRRPFQIQFLLWKSLYFHFDFIDIYSESLIKKTNQQWLR